MNTTLTPPTKKVPSTGEKPVMLFCEECGKGDAVRVGDRVLCLDCYALSGACCADPLGGDEQRLIHEEH